MFLKDKYTPKNITEISFHHDIYKLLENMSKDESVPHTIFYGPDGSGKNTLIGCFLEMLYGPEVNTVTNTNYTVAGSGNKTEIITVRQSNHHITIVPFNNNFDRYIIQDIVKKYARKIPLNIFTKNRSFKIVLINNIDSMSYFAQTSLRRMMEIYSNTCRFIMSCHSLSKVIDPLKSRCICIRVPSPRDSELFLFLHKIAYYEKLELKLSDFENIINMAEGNIKKALWMLELTKFGYDYIVNYDETINKIVNNILSANTTKLQEIRNLVYNLLITNFSGSKIIFDVMTNICKKKLPEKVKYFIRENAAKYEHNLVRGRREIIHIEAFVISMLECIASNK